MQGKTSTAVVIKEKVLLEFNGHVTETDVSKIKDALQQICSTICHDITVLLYDHVLSYSNGRTDFEVPVVCDGKMLKNGDLKTRLNKMSAKEVGAIFPFKLVGKELKKSGENEDWVTNKIPLLAGASGGVMLVVIVIIVFLKLKKRNGRHNKKSNMADDPYLDCTVGQDSAVMNENPLYFITNIEEDDDTHV